jgi:hypothetical protein
MKQRTFGSVTRTAAVSLLLICSALGVAQDLQPVTLPPPRKTGGMPLMEALAARQTIRSFGEAKLPPQMLSNLLWAAFGVNRPEGQGPRGKAGRTAPSAMNMQEIDLYVAMAEGVYLYEAIPHKLTPVAAKDIRSIAARRPEWAKAPIILIYTADTDKRPAPRPGTPPAPPQQTPGQPPAPPSAPGTTLGDAPSGLAPSGRFPRFRGGGRWFHRAKRVFILRLGRPGDLFPRYGQGWSGQGHESARSPESTLRADRGLSGGKEVDRPCCSRFDYQRPVMIHRPFF